MNIDSSVSAVYALNTSFYGIEPGAYLNLTENIDFPETNDPVWLLGCEYSSLHQLNELREDFRSRLLITYRKGFMAIDGTGPTSDQGWGCMLRCGQMLLAQALIVNHLGRDWRWKGKMNSNDTDDEEYINFDEDDIVENADDVVASLDSQNSIGNNSPNKEEIDEMRKYCKILGLFLDRKTSPYSIHQIALMGASEGKQVGQWFGPNTIAQALKKLSAYDHWNNVHIHVALDNVVIIDEIKSACKRDKSLSQVNADDWKPLVLFIPLRLGLSEVNPIYFRAIRNTFKLKQTLGIIGGRPNHAYYFIGFIGNDLVYLDPHKTQPVMEFNKISDIFNDQSYHQDVAYRVNINQLDPSLALGFFFQSEKQFDDWVRIVRALLITNEKQPLFEIHKEQLCMPSFSCTESPLPPLPTSSPLLSNQARSAFSVSDYDVISSMKNKFLSFGNQNHDELSKDSEDSEFEFLG